MKSKKGSISGKGNTELSKPQAHVLSLLTEQFLTVKKVALKRKTSIRAVYKIIAKLKAKGVLTGTQYRGFKKRGVHYVKGSISRPTGDKKIRLHGEAWRITIIDKTPFYDKFITKYGNRLEIDDNLILLHPNTIVVYCSEGRSFYAGDVYEATRLSLLYWNKIFSRIENRLNLTLLKQSYSNVKRFRQHYAETNNELAKDYNEKKVKIKIFAPEDGKLWFMIDASFTDEAETQHPLTAMDDMNKVKQVFDDIRSKPSLLPSEVTTALTEITQIQKVEVSKMGYYAENIKAHVGAVKDLGSKVDQWGKATEKMNKLLDKLNKKL